MAGLQRDLGAAAGGPHLRAALLEEVPGEEHDSSSGIPHRYLAAIGQHCQTGDLDALRVDMAVDDVHRPCHIVQRINLLSFRWI